MTPRVLTAHQPSYFPWLGYFAKLARADLFCVFDCVQFGRKDFSNRVMVKTQQGPLWLTVPVEHGQPLLKDARIGRGNWRRDHIRTIELAYGKAPFFSKYFPSIRDLIRAEYERLEPLCTDAMLMCMDWLGIKVPIIKASELQFSGYKSGLVLDMCRKLGASHYVFGANGHDYADLTEFSNSGVSVEFMQYNHPEYRQLHGAFVPGLSVIDALMNVGPKACELLERETVPA